MITMYRKIFLVLLSAVVLLASTLDVFARRGRDRRSSGLSVRQTELDEQFARRHPTIVPGTSPKLRQRSNR